MRSTGPQTWGSDMRMGWTWSVVGTVLWTALALLGGCGDEAEDGGIFEGPERFGCPTYPRPTAQPGDAIGGDDYVSFARPLFETYCTRCHSSGLTTSAERSLAPAGLDWDVEATVRANLARIRRAIGEENFMPPSDPTPSCAERLRLVRWIDAGAP
jgi:hypothetical protein